MTIKKLLIILIPILCCFSKNILADNVQFTASAKNNVVVGEQFRLTFTLNAQGSRFQAPSIKDFDILTGPNQSSSSSIQIINGSMTQSVTYTYTYVLQAIKEGTFTIPSATVTVDSKTIKSNSITINVGKSSTPQTQANQQKNKQTQTATNSLSGDYIFIKASVDNPNPYQCEQIIVTYKLYTRVQVSQYGISELPTNPGFWSQELLKENQQPVQSTETINGIPHTVAEIRKVALFPQKSGKLTIDPIEVECIATVKSQREQSRDPFEMFFGNPFSSYQNVKKVLKSNSISINVKPLPVNNKPSDFNSAVGSFSLKSTIDKTELKTNEAVNLKFTISGTGNLKLIDKLNITFPPDLETYDPKISDNISVNRSGMSGSRTFEYLIIPRNAGRQIIKPVSFSYFDLGSKTYKTLTSPEFVLNVAKGEGDQSNVTISSVNQEDIKYIGSDIRFIKNAPFILHKTGNFFFASNLFFLLLFIPFIIFILLIIIWRKELKKRSNVALMKHRKATKVSRKRLKKANAFLKENHKEAFYIEISRALWGYLSDKLSIPLSELSIDNINQTLKEKNIHDDIIRKFTDTLNDCEFNRFAPNAIETTMEKVYIEAMETIKQMEKELK